MKMQRQEISRDNKRREKFMVEVNNLELLIQLGVSHLLLITALKTAADSALMVRSRLLSRFCSSSWEFNHDDDGLKLFSFAD